MAKESKGHHRTGALAVSSSVVNNRIKRARGSTVQVRIVASRHLQGALGAQPIHRFRVQLPAVHRLVRLGVVALNGGHYLMGARFLGGRVFFSLGLVFFGDACFFATHK